MTNEIKLEVTCVHCLGVGEKQLYPIINRQDLEAKQNIFEEDLFLYRCPHCGHYQRISYECMYYDEKLKYAVVLSHDGHRFVKSVSELKEKIVIKENGLDDRIVEIMKHNIQTTLRSKASYQLVLRDGQGLEFVLLYPDNEVIKIFMFNKQDYLTLTKKYNRCLANDYIVDRLFASRTVLRLNKFNNLKLNCH